MRTALTVEKNDSTKSSETRLDFMASLKEGECNTEEVNNMRVAYENQACIQVDTLRNAVSTKESYLPKLYLPSFLIT